MEIKRINLALQGGGAHGAYTWGVLDRLLEERTLRLRAVSGASAGAMNAVVMSSGWMAGGAQGARDALERFWLRVGSLPSGRPSHDVVLANLIASLLVRIAAELRDELQRIDDARPEAA